MKKSLLIILACVMSVIIFQGFTVSRDPEFKNLQILPKDISDHDLDSVMHHFSQSLGVRCDFCHAKNDDGKRLDFVSDAKPEKNIARKMMLMAIDINKNYFVDMEMDHDMDKNHMDSSHMDMDHKDKEMKMKSMDTTSMNNSRYMLMEVNCYTCHRGNSHPDSKLPPHKQGPPPPPPVAPK